MNGLSATAGGYALVLSVIAKQLRRRGFVDMDGVTSAIANAPHERPRNVG